MYKPIQEVRESLAERLDPAKTKQVQKGGGQSFTYVSWETAVRELDRIFGPEGWSATPGEFRAYPGQGIYIATLTLTGYANDNGEVVAFSRPGFGRSVAQPSKAERDQGLTVTQNLQTHDTAASAAGSDALSKATKLLGDAFGLYLYDKDDVASQGTNSSYSAPRTTSAASSTSGGSGLGARPSEKQAAVLVKNGYSEEQVASLPFATWKACVDAIFNKTEAPVAPAATAAAAGNKKPATTRSRAAAPATEAEDGDDLNF